MPSAELACDGIRESMTNAGYVGAIAVTASVPALVGDLPQSYFLGLVGLLFTLLMGFVRSEYNGIKTDGEATRKSVHEVKSVLTALTLTLETKFGEIKSDHEKFAGETRTELAKRADKVELGNSLGRLHEKINRGDRLVSWMQGKIGMTQREEPEQ